METSVTRTILATATALVAATTLLTSAAEACISCEYVPEVVRSSSTLPHTGQYYAAPKKEYSAAPAKRRIVKSEPVAKKLNTAKAAVTKTTEVAKAEPAETPTATESENSSISLASNEALETAPVAEPAKEAAAKPTDCKKFFASVGMTLTVPCD